MQNAKTKKLVMGVGRKRKPTVIKKSQGTLQPCRTNELEPDYILLKNIPDPPPYLSGVGREVYYSTASELLELGILSRISLTVFVMYCIEVGRYFDALESVNKEGLRIVSRLGETIINPSVKIGNDSLSNIIRLAGEFGITPASKSKVSATIPKKNNDEWLDRKLKK